jgi:1,6-anhydro-N-acetylmuramate kinase
VASVILHAAEHPARDLVCGGAAQALILKVLSLLSLGWRGEELFYAQNAHQRW